MISFNDQNELFELIASKLNKDITCYAFGGTAMIFYGYKDATKDIDLIFTSEEDKDEFISTIKELGYKQQSLKKIYDDEHLKREGKPLMFTRDDERFDLFTKSIFTTSLTKTMREDFHAQYDFTRGENTLTVRALAKEFLILLKSVTDRERDYQDILTILQKESDISWDKIIDAAIEISKKDKHILLDLEKTMQRLKKDTFIPEKHFKKIYDAF